ncbi:uncharacterized protein LOC105428425 [Pogonomyrmex barbatus]|uniref:Uncharacterized protein LOC105428425 n=1 Tax=Pogonomyrmex barbatus TaxID=144034 RepID=A0A6I9WAK8_9HYME|nr:uncharacterized protein LOC105428425 [Pogonomyrmex barbatus]
MDARRALPFLLLVIYIISAVFAIQNGRGGSNYIRRIRRISEYLVPPPPPGFRPYSRNPRLATPQPTDAPGYFSWMMKWLNPFSSESSSQPPPPLPPPPPLHETSYSPSPGLSPPGPPATLYNGPPPVVNPPPYEKPPLPPSPVNDQSAYPSSAKGKSCNSCNRVPWMPIQNPGEAAHSGDASYIPPPPPPQIQSSLNGEYLPPVNHEVPYDAHHAASQEVRAPDFSFASPLPIEDQDNSFIGPLPNPHLFPGALPPLFKAGDFNYPSQVASDENLYLDAPPPPPSVSGNSALTGNGSFLDVTRPAFNGGHNEQSVYPNPSIHQELGYPTNSGEFDHFQDHRAHGDLSSSGTQVSHGHVNPVPDKQEYENKDLFDSVNHQTSIDSSGVQNRQPSGVPNNAGFYEVTGSSGPTGNFLDNAGPINQNLPSYGISDLDQIPNRYNDLSTSANVAESSHVPPRALDGSSGKIEDSINFEESPLLDFTHTDESRTDSSSISPTSNAFGGFESSEIAGTTVVPGEEIFGIRQGVASTQSHLSPDYLETISKVNNNTIQNATKSLYDPTVLREQDVSYTSPLGKTWYPWSNVLSTTPNTDTIPQSFWNILKPYDDAAEDILSQNINLNETQQGAKRNKQVQVIIPYTSQYTPLPFHPTHEKKISDASESNHDNYAGEESRNRIKVASPPNSSIISPTWPTTLPIFENVTKKPISIKANNSIDVHRLQKNIDNWTIQEYSKGTTASTVSPSSSNPYLFPSKKIPDEYLTTTEPVDHIDDSHKDNVKTFTLAGFSFNDLEYKESASNRVETTQAVNIKKSTESSTDTPTTSTNVDIWQSFPVGISQVNKERVHVVTPQPVVTSKSTPIQQKKEKTVKEVERNTKESRKASETDIKKTKTKSEDTFESIEKAYQVLPQAVNNLAVASTGPESVPLWGIMEHEEFALPEKHNYENEDEFEHPEILEIPMLYSGHSKVSRARR